MTLNIYCKILKSFLNYMQELQGCTRDKSLASQAEQNLSSARQTEYAAAFS